MLVADGLGGLPIEPGGPTELEAARLLPEDERSLREQIAAGILPEDETDYSRQIERYRKALGPRTRIGKVKV